MDQKTVAQKDLKGRAAGLNPSSRFDKLSYVDFEDGWASEDDLPPAKRTQFEPDSSRSILAKNTSPDLHFDRSVNPYRGCEHGCIYCFARPSHAYLGLSPGFDFETRIMVKHDAPALLRETLSRRGYVPKTIAMGTNTDPYQPGEVRFELMRGILKVLSDFRHPLGVVTKGALIRRDADILGEMGQAGLAGVGVSITTLDAGLSRKLEPRAAAPAMRLRMIETLAQAGCPVRVMVAPVIPGLTDHELERILEAARDAGATTASYIALRMPLEVGDLMRDWLNTHAPERASRVISGIRAFHGGKDYDPDWGKRMTGSGPEADLLAARFKVALRRFGLSTERPRLRKDLFAVPGRGVQMDLF